MILADAPPAVAFGPGAARLSSVSDPAAPTHARALSPDDELAHALGPGEREAWHLDLVVPDGSLGVAVQVEVAAGPAVGGAGAGARLGLRCRYTAAVVRPGQPLVVLLDDDVPPPGRPDSVGVRGTGLWSDLDVETPFEHVSLAVEAFALAVDAPVQLGAPLVGDRVPLGLDLEWESDEPVRARPGGYALACRVHGEVLLGRERLAVDGFGFRQHVWGAPSTTDVAAPPGATAAGDVSWPDVIVAARGERQLAMYRQTMRSGACALGWWSDGGRQGSRR